MSRNQLVQTTTSDGLYLHGYYSPTSDKKVAFLHIHGFEGNFYENNFVHVLADTLEKANIPFLSANTRGNASDQDFNTVQGKYKRIGARNEQLEEAHLDISAWMKLLIKEGYKTIVLQGHSLGTIKVIRYLFEGKYKNKVNKLILLAPFDKKALMDISGRKDIKGLLKKARLKVKQGKGDELITKEFEDIKLCYKTFISWYKQDDFGRMFEFCSPNYDFPILQQIKIPTKIIVGSKDEYFHLSNPKNPQEALDLMLKRIPQSEGEIIKGAVHSYKPYENIMAREVRKFVKQ